MAIKILKAVKPATNEAIRLFEIGEGIVIPNPLKEFWKNYNPIYTEQNIYFKDGEKYYLDRFFPFSDECELSFQTVFMALGDYLKKEYLPFANDSGDWQFLVSINKESNGEIFLCRMDEIIPDSLVKMSDSFEEFINGLKRDEEV